jgi:hypothetical protein
VMNAFFIPDFALAIITHLQKQRRGLSIRQYA